MKCTGLGRDDCSVVWTKQQMKEGYFADHVGIREMKRVVGIAHRPSGSCMNLFKPKTTGGNT